MDKPIETEEPKHYVLEVQSVTISQATTIRATPKIEAPIEGNEEEHHGEISI